MVWKTFTTRADAEAWLEDQRGAIRQGTFSEDHRMTVEAWLTRWLAVKDRELRPTTRLPLAGKGLPRAQAGN